MRSVTAVNPFYFALVKLDTTKCRSEPVQLTMASQIASSGKAFAAAAAGICFDRCLRLLLLLLLRLVLCLLRELVHRHVRHVAHARHVGEVGHGHGGRHGVLHVHGSLHGTVGKGSRHAVRRVLRVL